MYTYLIISSRSQHSSIDQSNRVLRSTRTHCPPTGSPSSSMPTIGRTRVSFTRTNPSSRCSFTPRRHLGRPTRPFCLICFSDACDIATRWVFFLFSFSVCVCVIIVCVCQCQAICLFVFVRFNLTPRVSCRVQSKICPLCFCSHSHVRALSSLSYPRSAITHHRSSPLSRWRRRMRRCVAFCCSARAVCRSDKVEYYACVSPS